MKRFWKEAALAETEAGYGITLDGKPLRTPAKAFLEVPSKALAEAVVGEWNAVDGEVDPRAMRMTGLANAAIDRVAPDRQAFAANLAKYAEADLLCYRAEAPRELVDRQEQAWSDLLAWASRRFDVELAVTTGITHVAQPQATLDRLAHEVAVLGPFQLAGLSPMVTAGGSLVAGLAVLDGARSAEQAWAAVALDDEWQKERWGSDAEAEKALEGRRADFFAGARFLELLAA